MLTRALPRVRYRPSLGPVLADPYVGPIETHVETLYIHRMGWKRGQVELVLWALLSGPGHTACLRLGTGVKSDFRARLKHLLDLDRSLAASNHQPGANQPVLAFHDALPQGKGNEASFSAENALSLAVALECLHVGFPQKAVVELMVKLRPQLERRYRLATSVRKTKGGVIFTEVKEGQFPTVFSVRKSRLPRADLTQFLILHSLEFSRARRGIDRR